MREAVERMRVGDKIDSDHHSIEIWMKGETGRRGRNKGVEERWRGYGRKKEGRIV